MRPFSPARHVHGATGAAGIEHAERVAVVDAHDPPRDRLGSGEHAGEGDGDEENARTGLLTRQSYAGVRSKNLELLVGDRSQALEQQAALMPRVSRRA